MSQPQENVPTIGVMVLNNVGNHIATLVYAVTPAVGDEIQTSGSVHQIVRRRFLPIVPRRDYEVIVWVETLPSDGSAWPCRSQ